MIELHLQFLTKNGEKEFAVLPYEEFIKIQKLLEELYPLSPVLQNEKKVDYQNLEDLLKRQKWKEADEKTTRVME